MNVTGSYLACSSLCQSQWHTTSFLSSNVAVVPYNATRDRIQDWLLLRINLFTGYSTCDSLYNSEWLSHLLFLHMHSTYRAYYNSLRVKKAETRFRDLCLILRLPVLNHFHHVVTPMEAGFESYLWVAMCNMKIIIHVYINTNIWIKIVTACFPKKMIYE